MTASIKSFVFYLSFFRLFSDAARLLSYTMRRHFAARVMLRLRPGGNFVDQRSSNFRHGFQSSSSSPVRGAWCVYFARPQPYSKAVTRHRRHATLAYLSQFTQSFSALAAAFSVSTREARTRSGPQAFVGVCKDSVCIFCVILLAYIALFLCCLSQFCFV